MATTGKPAIGTPSRLDLRSLQLTINNIRERLKALDDAVNASTTEALKQDLLNQIGVLRVSLTALSKRVSKLESALSGDTFTMLANEAITVGQPVVAVSSTRCAVADPNDMTEMFALLGVATNTAAAGAEVVIRVFGPMTITGAAWDTGHAVYVGGGGGLTQIPNYEAVSIPVGVAVGPATLFVSPGWPALYDDTFAQANTPHSGFVPVTYALLQALIADLSGGDVVLYDNTGRAMLTGDGRALLVGS